MKSLRLEGRRMQPRNVASASNENYRTMPAAALERLGRNSEACLQVGSKGLGHPAEIPDQFVIEPLVLIHSIDRISGCEEINYTLA